MGTNLAPLLEAKEISLNDLHSKKLVFDAHNQLYMYLSIIRQPDGSLLRDSKNQVTSHLSGLFFRTLNLMEKNIKLAYVFDGKPPELKEEEIIRRRSRKEEAGIAYREAEKKGDIAGMKKYASRTSKLTEEMIKEAKALIRALGLPVIQAPSEGEAQAAYMVNKGEFYGLVSQDTDGLLFGAPRLIKNLTISRRRKAAGRSVQPEVIGLAENMNRLGIDRNQLIVMGMLVGTDYNVGGVKGIGPKTALRLVKKKKHDFDALFKDVGWEKNCNVAWQKIFYLFKHMPVTEEYELDWKNINKKEVLRIMGKHDFFEERIEHALEKLHSTLAQKGLGDWL